MKIKILPAGFSLIEVMVSIAIFTVLMLSLNLVFVSLYRQQGNDMAMLERLQQSGRLVEQMGKELRGCNRGENGHFALAVVADTSLTFFSDVDNDGQTEMVAYALSGNNLMRTVTEPGADKTYATAGTPAVVCAGVRTGNPIFTYYGEDYTGSESPLAVPVSVLDVKLVGVDFTLSSPNGNSSYPLHTETKIELRNLK